MEAIFFRCGASAASGIRSAEDLPVEAAGEPLRIGDPGALLSLVEALGLPARSALTQLRDATCQSFPVWQLAPETARKLATLADEQLEAVAQRWIGHPGSEGMDADLHELCELLEALRDAPASDGAQLFVLLEEKAL